MEIFGLRILTIVTLIQGLRIFMFLLSGGVFLFSMFSLKDHFIFSIAGMFFLLMAKEIYDYVKKTIVSRAKHPLPLNLLCNIIELGKPFYFGKDKFDLDEIINDNQLPLTLNYIHNSQYPVLQFDKDKLFFHNREYHWKDLNWKYFIDGVTEYGRNHGKYIIEFEGTDPDHNRIKNKIEFEKIKAQENEVILLFIIHDLLFGKRSSYYY
ncbi:hypothetical protein ACVVIH_17540 [Chryseobacterium arthrosphaerae]|uniref:hypothetical protein n=1 Tax=Chryseobacterium arthrosphaerae TaxID=651561 RepID=UPI001BB02A29|nr:hypothetical protein [Chryseobacterium arthrosphaerae]QUY55543.1 hypothetical protein I2F65_22245 [Chryseobacterium arthrosphaerae]